ncbi:hypothetical protein GCM10009682_18420 [Luedemannella flava]|uniref:DUF3263 domain-containing protein n=1 Tax=Luedemannella flava TaxID=349316 RepID=A0ABP4XZ62_9ACTN
MDAADAHTGLDIDHLPRVGIQRTDADELDWPTDMESAPAEADPAAPPALTDQQREILTFERQWWRHAGAKEQAIRDLFGISPTRYYQSLNALLDNPAALSHDPTLVKRLRRLRATRQRSRNTR